MQRLKCAKGRGASSQWHAHMAAFWHEGPPEGHSSPATQIASLSPQFTEQPPQLPRGLEGGAVQELSCPSRSLLGGALALVLGGPVSLEDGAGALLSPVTQAASDRAMRTLPASNAADIIRRGRVLTDQY